MTRALWNTNGRIYELLQVRREQIATPHLDAESQHLILAEVDKAIREYVVGEISENPNSIHQFILESRARQQDLKAEKKRIDGLLAAEEGEEALATHILTEVLTEIGETSLPVRGTLRLQPNGGIEPLEVTNVYWLPEGLKRYTLTMRGDLYHWLWSVVTEFEKKHAVHPLAHQAFDDASSSADNSAIREALKQRMPCPNCNDLIAGVGFDLTEYGGGKNEPCPTCQGKRTVPVSIPGARLLERGSHLRVS